MNSPERSVRKFFCTALMTGAAVTVCLNAYAQVLPRTVLAIYDSSEFVNQREDYNRIHRFAETPLNYLGYKVTYHDIQSGIPSQIPSDLAAVMTWFVDDRIPDPSAYLDFSSELIRSGVKYIIFDQPGFFSDQFGNSTDSDKIRNFFRSLDLHFENTDTDSWMKAEIVHKVAEMTEFERTLENEISSYMKIIPVDPETSESYLILGLKDESGTESSVVCITAKAGIALGDYALYSEISDGRAQWRIDPFSFFRKVFEDRLKIVPDTTTLFGKRIFYSHIDGDGFRNLSHTRPGTISGKVILDEVIDTYRLPVTVSYITAELDQRYFGTEDGRKLAVETLSRSNVEPAVHAFSHPLDWKNKITAFEIDKYSYPIDSEKYGELLDGTLYKKGFVIDVSDSEYISREIDESVTFINDLIEESGKKVEIYLWSGDTSPSKEMIQRVEELGIENMNGGDSMFDTRFNSYTSVTPLTRQQEGTVQIHSSNANENSYTNGWTGPFYGFQNVIQTFENTDRYDEKKDRHIRISPINIYYHFYIGERNASLRSVRLVHDYALNQDIHPVFASHYARIVRGYLSAEIQVDTDGVWTVSDYGECRTLRADADGSYPDIRKSLGVFGYRVVHDKLYIHLADAERARIVFTDEPSQSPFLEHSSAAVNGLEFREKEGLLFSSELFRTAEYTFRNMEANSTYDLILKDRNGKYLLKEDVLSDSTGLLKINLKHAGLYTVELRKR